MAREQSPGRCDQCSQAFGYYLIHSGFNDSVYAYCDSCCYTAIASLWKIPSQAPRVDYGIITSELEPYLQPCPSRGQFTAAARPRCPHCTEPLDPVRAAEYIEPHQPGTAKGWRWQRLGLASTVLSSMSELFMTTGMRHNRRNQAMERTADRCTLHF